MIVTALHERPRGRVEIQLDGSPWRLVPAAAVVRSGLQVGGALDRETARTLARELRHGDALARAARALSPRERSRLALDGRLERAGVPARTRGEALETLERAGLVDDARMSARRAEGLAERGYGDAAIRYDLEQEGISAELVEEALAGLEPERERVRALVERRGADVRTGRWLAARGFDAVTVEDQLGGGFAQEP